MTGAEARSIRNEMGISQQKLSDVLGVRRATVSDLERGKYPVSTVYAMALRYVRMVATEIEEEYGEAPEDIDWNEVLF